LRFEYHYDFMPSGILTRFIARNHSLIDGSGFWRNGVRLVWEGAKALVVSEPLRRRITVTVAGSDPRTLLSMVRRDLMHIQATLNNPDVREMIPCICRQCRVEGNEPELMRYRFLLAQEQGGIPQVVCERSGERVSLKEILSGIVAIAEPSLTSRAAPDGTTILQIQNVENFYAQTENNMTPQTTPARQGTLKAPSPWVSGGFYLVTFVVIVVGLAVIAKSISGWILPMIIIGGLIALSVIGAFDLRRSDLLSERNFLQLMTISFRQLPLLRRFWRREDTTA